MTELCFTPARKLARLIRARKLSVTEVMQAFIGQIERVNPKVNAIVTFVPELALKKARSLDKAKTFGPLAGLPIAYKDLVPTKGVRTTFGSLIYEKNIPQEDHLIVERLGGAGAILVGKTNTPEFGAGSQTFNAVFGATRNPYDTTKTCGGSSGGAAVALACGMLPIADGSDLGGSLRNPANFCNVVGFRPTPGRVPNWPTLNAWDTLPVLGPMARTVADCAFLFSAMAGPDARSPISLPEPGAVFAKSLKRNFRKVRIAWSCDLGGLPFDPRVSRVLSSRRKVFEELGCIIEAPPPDFNFDGATEAFETLRALGFFHKVGPLMREHRDKLKDTVIWNAEEGLKRRPVEIARAEYLRTELFHRMRRLLERYEFFVCPVSQVPPFPVEQPYPTEIAGTRMGNYIDWMKSCYYITITSHPAISVPAGFTDDGLPVGIQIVGRYRDDFGVLQLAHAFESETEVWKRRPELISVKE